MFASAPMPRYLCETFDGKFIPYDEGTFDIVMFVDVIHHTEQPMTCYAKQFVWLGRRFLSRITSPKERSLTQLCALWIGSEMLVTAFPFHIITGHWPNGIARWTS